MQNIILFHIGASINFSVLNDFVAKLLKLPISFFDSKRTGDILQRMNDHDRIENFLTGSSLNAIFSIVNLSIFLIVLISLDTTVFGIFALCSAIYASTVMFFLRLSKIYNHNRFAISSQAQNTAIELIQGMQEVKLNGIEKQIGLKWQVLQVKSYKLFQKVFNTNQQQRIATSVLNEIRNAVILLFSAKAVIAGKLTLGDMLAIQYIVGTLNSPLENLIGPYTVLPSRKFGFRSFRGNTQRTK